MKAIGIKILNGYLIIGILFAFLLELSWSWSLLVTLFTQFDVWFSFGGFVGLIISVAVNMILEPIIRALFWLPSVLSLSSPDALIGFWQWMLPGFYDPIISVEKIS